MNISYNWLKDYVPTSCSAKEVADLLTFSGLEVEGLEKVESIKGGLEKYVIGKVLTCAEHPNSDHLHLTTVDVGQAEPLHIVCGAPNVAAGQTVVVATVGAKVYDGDECFEIKKSKLRGEVSEGMICSEKELQLSNNHAGIMVLESGVPGTPAKEYFNITDDTVLEIGLTANRSDAASHLGVGRDLVAVLRSQNVVSLSQSDASSVPNDVSSSPNDASIALHIPSVDGFKVDEDKENISINIDENLCGRYSALTISGVEVKESPDWLKTKLNAIGIRPINNIVDITNFVLMECGQPLHAFDLDKITSKTVNVKTLPEGTKFVTLDGIERKLNGKEVMICNGDTPMCLGGIFGGKDSGISETTTNIFLESAYFNPVVIRKAAKYHQLSTDASFRYERGADPNITVYALKRAAMLIKELAGGKISSEIKDVYPNVIERAVIDLSYDYFDTLVGKQIEREKIKQILCGLDMEIAQSDEKHIVVKVPTNKVDVTRPCDLAEEILRIYGYNNIEFPDGVKSSLSYTPNPNKGRIQNIITSYLADNGFNETMNNSLTSSSYYKENGDYPLELCVNLLNPLSSDLDVMRQTLLYGQLEVVSYNLNRKTANIRLFEFGNCYKKNFFADADAPVNKRYLQEKHLVITVCGKLSEDSWQRKAEDADFFYLKNMVINVLRRLRIDVTTLIQNPADVDYLSEGIMLVNKDNKKAIAVLGKVSQKLRKQFDIKSEVFFADINWDNVIKILPKKEVKYANISKFPSVRRDLALVVDNDTTFESVEMTIRDCDKKLIRGVNLFDDYKGLKEPGKKQYAVSIILQDEQKTLTDKQIESVINKIVKTLEFKLQAKIRQ